MNNAKAANARTIGPMTEAVASELRAELARQKRSAKNLAEANGLNRSTLHKTLNAQRAIDVDDLYQLADMLGVDPAELFTRASQIARARILEDAVRFVPDQLDRGTLSEQENVTPMPRRDVRPLSQDGPTRSLRAVAKKRSKDRGGEDGQG